MPSSEFFPSRTAVLEQGNTVLLLAQRLFFNEQLSGEQCYFDIEGHYPICVHPYLQNRFHLLGSAIVLNTP